MIIYKIVNKINGKVYVGQTTKDLNHRIREHLSEAKTKGVRIIGKAFQRYGIESFEISIIDNATSREVLDEKERYWIAFHGCINPTGYNLTEGGNGSSGYTVSEESRKRMSEAKKGKPSGRKGAHQSEETKAKLREFTGERSSMYGKHLSEATKKKLSEAHTGKVLSGEHRQKLSDAKKANPVRNWLGKHRSEETKAKLREYKGERSSFYGKHHSTETKNKLSEQRKGNHPSEETRRKISDKLKGNIPWNKGMKSNNKEK